MSVQAAQPFEARFKGGFRTLGLGVPGFQIVEQEADFDERVDRRVDELLGDGGLEIRLAAPDQSLSVEAEEFVIFGTPPGRLRKQVDPKIGHNIS